MGSSSDAWRIADPGGIRTRYDGLLFDRTVLGQNAATRVLGVGHALIDVALAEVLTIEAPVARVQGLSSPLFVVGIEDQVTGQRRPVARLLFGASFEDGEVRVLRDWELLRRLNSIRARTDDALASAQPSTPAERRVHEDLLAALEPNALSLADEFTHPILVQEAFLLPTE